MTVTNPPAKLILSGTTGAVIVEALHQCIAALERVEPQIRGALPMQDVTLAIATGKAALAKAGLR